LKPEVGEKFDESTPMTVKMYEEKRIKDPEVWQYTDSKSLKTNFSVQQNDNPVLSCYIENIVVDDVSAATFTRTLNVFGYKWTKDESGELRDGEEPPTDFEIAGFLELFANVNTRTKEGWIAFLQEFQMEKIYQFDDTVPDHWKDLSDEFKKRAIVFKNMAQFTDLVNMIQGSRFGLSDGNHRGVTQHYILTACYNLTRVVPLVSNAITAMINGAHVLTAEALAVFENHETNQAFKNQKFRVGSLFQDAKCEVRATFEEQCAAFRKAGDVAAAASNRVIGNSIREFNDKVFGKLHPLLTEAHEKEGCVGSYKNYWKPGRTLETAMKKTAELGCKIIIDVIMESATARQFVIGSSKTSTDALVDAVGKLFLRQDQFPINFGNLKRPKNKAMSQDLALYLYLLRAACFSPTALVNLKSLLDIPGTCLEQRGVNTGSDFSILRWIADNVLSHVNDVANHYREKAMAEKYIIECCQYAPKDKKWSTMYFDSKSEDGKITKKRNDDYVKQYNSFVKEGQVKPPKQGEQEKQLYIPNMTNTFFFNPKNKLTHTKMMSTKKSTLDARVEFGGHYAILNDVIDCLVAFGLDPQMLNANPNPEAIERNSILRSYLAIDP